MTTEKDLAQNRLSLLGLADKLRSVSKEFWRHSVSRSQFCESNRAYRAWGLESLLERRPITKAFPNETIPKVRERVLFLSLELSALGAIRVSDHLLLDWVSGSPSAVCNSHSNINKETPYTHLVRLQDEKDQEIELTKEQISLLEIAAIRPFENERWGILILDTSSSRIPSIWAPVNALAGLRSEVNSRKS
jgi:hypothetical protein